MSETHDHSSDAAQPHAPPPPPEEPAPAPTSLGVSKVFEVEEQAPDGAPVSASAPPTAPEETAEPAQARDERPTDLPTAESPSDGAAENGAAAAHAPAAADDDEPAPQLSWYVLKVQSSREDTIRDALERRVKMHGLERYFGRIVVPTEKITEIRNNKKRVVERKSYPGYIMAEMELNEKTWFVVRETPGVGDFVGAHGQPSPMRPDEVDKMLGREVAKDEKPPAVRIDVGRGDRVKIKDGPFENFEGTVEEVIEQRGLVKVMLIIFNRPTPVDLEYWQVERI
jgi:transcriptional antiterminator NusG